MKTFCLLLAGLLVCESSVLATQATPITGTEQVQKQEAAQVAKTKAQVQRRGTGEKSRVKVQLVNGSEVRGYVSKIEESSFTVTDKKKGQTTSILYEDVQRIRGPGWSKTATVLVAVGAGVVALVLFGHCVGTQSC